MPADWDAIVLTGGASRRMDGVAKPALEVGGRGLLDRVMSALGEAAQAIVVGPRAETAAVAVWTREDPPGGGPALALAAGVALVDAPFVAVLAGDLPFLTPATMRQLRLAADPVTVAIAVDDQARDQYLLAVWPTPVLRQTLAAAVPLTGRSLRAVYRDVAVRRVEPAGAPPPWWDCDTAEQLAKARTWADAEVKPGGGEWVR